MLRSITYSSNLRSQRSEKDKWLKLSANRANSDYYVHESDKNNVLSRKIISINIYPHMIGFV
jgi:hypothetical protein